MVILSGTLLSWGSGKTFTRENTGTVIEHVTGVLVEAGDLRDA